MRRTFILLAATVVLGMISCVISGQYSDYGTLMSKIEKLRTEYPALCSSAELVKTAGGKSVVVLAIGTGDKENKPGIAVAGGVDGGYIAGREMALGFASSLLKESSSEAVKKLLDEVTFYVFPDVSPDESAQYFASSRFQRDFNNSDVDEDRDFSNGEDPFEDIDKDGFITCVRIEDPSGQYTESSDDSRIMVQADASRGQTGRYILISEGNDNDHDGKFNEDGEGGVSFNRNFTYNYEEFGRNAGLHAVSEPETRAVADFLFDRFNIYAVFTFGPQDNLGEPFRAAENPRQERKLISIMKGDESINKLVSAKYHEITGLKGNPAQVKTPGNFMEWAYYHYGRFSFGTPGWWFPSEKGKNAEAEFLSYAEKNGLKDVFIPWKEVAHPDFPGRKAWAGGMKPFVMVNPPADSLGKIIDRNYRFITAIAAMHPRLIFLDVKTENAGSDVFRLSLKVHNDGIFPTLPEAGEFNNWTRIMRISLETTKDQVVLSGTRVSRIERLTGGGTASFSWLIQGKGPVKVTAGAVNTGIISTTLTLK